MSGFTYCLNTSTIRPTPLLEKIAIAGRAGYDAIEPWNDEVDDYLAQGGSLDELKQAIGDAGLKVASMIALHGWFDGGNRDDCCRRMEQAAALGSSFIVASPPHEIIRLDRASADYEELLAMGRAIGVRPAMEFLGFVAGVRSMAAAWAIAAGTGDPTATVVGDVFHMMRGGGSIDDLLQIGGDGMAIFHINDLPADPPPTAQADGDRVMVGEGIVDLPRVIAHLREIRYRGPLSLELFNESLWQKDPFEVARVGLERVRMLAEG